jgi:DNA-binding XRE family transcriptional regulator
MVYYKELKMKYRPKLPAPVLKTLSKLGQDISDARRRRRITMKLMAERAEISRTTVGKIEKGDPTTSISGYASVLFVLGMIERLGDMADAAHDLTGRHLEEEKLPKRVRLSHKINKGNNNE